MSTVSKVAIGSIAAVWCSSTGSSSVAVLRRSRLRNSTYEHLAAVEEKPGNTSGIQLRTIRRLTRRGLGVDCS